MKIHDFKTLATSPQAPHMSYATVMTGFPLIWPETKGAGIRLAVIDTGVANHKDFKDGIVEAPDVGLGTTDRNKHGTWCLGQIGARGEMIGCLPEIELISIKAFDDKGRGNERATLKAYEWCGANNIDVISMSYGGGKPSDPAHHRLLKELYNNGTVLTAAAGNMGLMFPDEDTVLYPAEFPEVIATTAIDLNQKFARFSSSGEAAEIAMPGKEVWGLGLDNSYIKLSGTSMGNPTTAAVAAAIIARGYIRFGRRLTPAEVRFAMQSMAIDLGIRGRDGKYGFGVFSFGHVEQQHSIKLYNGKKEYLVDGETRVMDTVPFINSDNRMMVPLRFVGEGLGNTVNWDPSNPDEVEVITN